jgi:hypothetical protein
MQPDCDSAQWPNSNENVLKTLKFGQDLTASRGEPQGNLSLSAWRTSARCACHRIGGRRFVQGSLLTIL